MARIAESSRARDCGCGPEIDDLDWRKRPCADALGQTDQPVIGFAADHGLQRRRGTSEQETGAFQPGPDQCDVTCVVAGRLAVLVARFVLFVDDNEPEPAHRRKDCGASTDCHSPLTPAQQSPGIRALAIGQTAVEHGDLVTV